MPNMNSFGGFQNLPAFTVASTAETTYKVPASGAYAGLPSPTQIAGNALYISALPGDVAGGALDFGRGFVVRVCGVVNAAQSENITISIYQVTSAVALAGFTAATGTGQTLIATTSTQATGAAVKASFNLEAACRWDAQSKIMAGEQWGQFKNNAVVARAALSNSPTALAYADLNFYLTFTASVGTSDVIGPFDFTIERY
jgi:hypothetical protein